MYDAAIMGPDGKALFFSGEQYFEHDIESLTSGRADGRSIESNWTGLWTSGLDAATNWGGSGLALFFRGSEFVSVNLSTQTADAPLPIEGNWPGVWGSGVDAAVDWGDGKLYLFKGNEYIRYDIENDAADPGYPRPIAGAWKGLWIDGVDAAINWGNGKVYFFRGNEYISYDTKDDKVDPGFPKPLVAPAGSVSEAPEGQELSEGRRAMLALIDEFMPTSLLAPRVPEGRKRDLLAEANWFKSTGQSNFALKQAGKSFATSCGDVLRALLQLWGSKFVGAFAIRDTDVKNGPGAVQRGYYVDATPDQTPKLGDILVLRAGVHKNRSLGHVGILVKIDGELWHTADGGGGALPDQTAKVTQRKVTYTDDGFPVLVSVTDGRSKQLDGWIDLDRLERSDT